MPHLILLGSQRYTSNLGEVVSDLDLKGPFAVITAGWQEREEEVSDLEAELGGQAINLMLYQRGEEVFQGDQQFRDAHRTHMERVKKLQDLYRKRIGFYMDAARTLFMERGKSLDEVVSPECEHAFEVARGLDARHLRLLGEMHAEFWEEWPREQIRNIQPHFNELCEVLERSCAVVVAGGHVAILLNRLRLFNLGPALREKPVIAWGAGAMCLGKQVVLFHDSPPQGKGNAEMFESGLGLFENVLPLPHANHRLLLDDPNRVSIFANRFKGNECLTLVRNSRLDFEDGQLHHRRGSQRLNLDGSLEGGTL